MGLEKQSTLTKGDLSSALDFLLTQHSGIHCLSSKIKSKIWQLSCNNKKQTATLDDVVNAIVKEMSLLCRIIE